MSPAVSVTFPTSTEKFFSKGIMVFNERELVFNNQFFIPDRLVCINEEFIIIDYKTGEPQKKHDKQLNDYANLLCKSGFKVKQKMIIYVNNQTPVISEV